MFICEYYDVILAANSLPILTPANKCIAHLVKLYTLIEIKTVVKSQFVFNCETEFHNMKLYIIWLLELCICMIGNIIRKARYGGDNSHQKGQDLIATD